MKKFAIWAIIATVALAGCRKDDDENGNGSETPLPTSTGMVVACEGSFNQNNASLHLITAEGEVINNVYEAANGFAPGDVLQSYRVFGDRGYVVLNNSQKVEVVNPNNFEVTATITGCDYPRDVLVVGNQGFISNGSLAGELLTFNASSSTITGSISVGNGPEQLAYNGTYVYVANSGGWGLDNTVSVIDPNVGDVVATVPVGDRPVALQVDAQNHVWVLCAGAIEYDENWNVVNETDARLVRIDGNQHDIIGNTQVGQNGDHPSFMAIDAAQNKIYIVNGGLLTADVNSGTISAGPIQSGNFRAVGIDPESGEIYLSSAPDYVSNDQVFVYGQNGVLQNTFEVGIAPRVIVAKN